MPSELRTYFEARSTPMLALLADLVQIESPTPDKSAVDRMGARVRTELESLGADITTHLRTEVGDILEARWNTSAEGRPLLFLCHMDTVHPLGALARSPIRSEEGRFYGPGSYDMKGGIVALLEALRGLIDRTELPDRPIHALFTSDEETGSRHSQALIEEHAQGAALAGVLEPATPTGCLKTWRKTVGMYRVRATGRASHAGAAPEAGINAIEEIAHQTLALQAMNDLSAGTSVTVSQVQGGTASNVVPEHCEISVDIRAMTVSEMQRMQAAMNSLRTRVIGATLEVSGGFDRPPLVRDERMIATFEQARAIAARHGITLREDGTGGASDGNFTAALGTPTLDGLGPTGDGAHSEREHIVIQSLPRSAAVLAALIREWVV